MLFTDGKTLVAPTNMTVNGVDVLGVLQHQSQLIAQLQAQVVVLQQSQLFTALLEYSAGPTASVYNAYPTLNGQPWLTVVSQPSVGNTVININSAVTIGSATGHVFASALGAGSCSQTGTGGTNNIQVVCWTPTGAASDLAFVVTMHTALRFSSTSP